MDHFLVTAVLVLCPNDIPAAYRSDFNTVFTFLPCYKPLKMLNCTWLTSKKVCWFWLKDNCQIIMNYPAFSFPVCLSKCSSNLPPDGDILYISLHKAHQHSVFCVAAIAFLLNKVIKNEWICVWKTNISTTEKRILLMKYLSPQPPKRSSLMTVIILLFSLSL